MSFSQQSKQLYWFYCNVFNKNTVGRKRFSATKRKYQVRTGERPYFKTVRIISLGLVYHVTEFPRVKKILTLSLFITQSPLLTTLGKNPFENIVGQGENAGDQHFLLFPPCFLSFPRQI